MKKKQEFDKEEELTFRPVSEFFAEEMKDPEFKKAYDALEWKYKLIDALIQARAKKGFTQEKLAKLMGTKQSAIARFESQLANPTIDFLQKLSKALGLELTITVR